MSKEQRPTDEDIRTRVQEIAVEAYLDTADSNEPLAELIERVRAGIRDEREQMTSLFQELEMELDQFETLLGDKPPHPEQAA